MASSENASAACAETNTEVNELVSDSTDEDGENADIAASESQLMAEGGYDVKLVEEPNVPLKTECLICQLTLRDPYETECCNTFVCKICVEKYEKRKADCFLCRKNLKYREAPARKRLLNQLKVYCTHSEQGCQWKGELGELDRHLNFSPFVTSIDTGCDFTEVGCPICHENFKRRDYSLHTIDQCPNEEIPCIYHTDGCQWRGERRTLEEHLCLEEVLKGCGYVSIKCEFGCQNEFIRKDIDKHMSKNVYQHLHQVRSELLLRVDHIQDNEGNVDELYTTIQQQKQRINKFEQKINHIFTAIIVMMAVHVVIVIGAYYLYQSLTEPIVKPSFSKLMKETVQFYILDPLRFFFYRDNQHS